jgi:MFS family permease
MAFAVLALCFTFNLLARGISETYAVFLLPLGSEFGWERAELASVYSIYMLVHGITAPLAGLLFDRLGPRLVYAFGFACYGGGYYLAGSLSELWQFYLCIGVLGGIGVATISMVPASALISRWYREKLTTAMSITYSGLGCGMLLIVPLTQLLQQQRSWRETYTLLGGSLLLLLPVVLLLPWQRIAAGHPEYMRERRERIARDGGWTLPRALRSSHFWAMFGVFFFTSVAVYAVSLQAIAYLVEIGFDPLRAASAFGFTGMLSVVGMVAAGWLADRFGRRRVVTISYLFTISGTLCLFALSYLPVYALLSGFVVLFGIVQGSRGPIVSALAARLFPGGGLGAIYGAITTGMGFGAATGSWCSGLLHDLTGGYSAGFTLGMLAAVCGMSLFWLVPALGETKTTYN